MRRLRLPCSGRLGLLHLKTPSLFFHTAPHEGFPPPFPNPPHTEDPCHPTLSSPGTTHSLVPLPTRHAKACVPLLSRWKLCHVPLIYRFLISLPLYAHWCPKQFWTGWINQKGWLGSPMANILSQAGQQPRWNSLKWSDSRKGELRELQVEDYLGSKKSSAVMHEGYHGSAAIEHTVHFPVHAVTPWFRSMQGMAMDSYGHG